MSAPPRPPKPGQVKVVRALYKYTAQYPDELSFEEGELLYISDPVSSCTGSDETNWLKARCGTRVGLIPSNYVEDNEVLETPLHDASKRGNIGFLEECLMNGVSCNTLDKSGSTALYWAAHGGHIACMNLLLTKKIDINFQNKLGDTALHAAAWKNRTEAIDLLLKNGADINVTNCEGKTALMLASDPQVVNLLKKHKQNAVKDSCDNDSDYFVDDNDVQDSD